METNEGYVILQEETYHTDEKTGDRYRIVLGHRGGDFPQYVTWESTVRVNASGEDRYDYFWGHYFNGDSKIAARLDYHTRLLSNYSRHQN